jgi:hypothetical protein
LDKNTIIIYLSDNGPNGWRWNGGMRGRKGSTDEGGVRSPFFIQWKGILPAGKNVSKLAGAIDILPTLASLSGIKLQTANAVDGENLHPLLLDENTSWRDRFMYSHWNGKTSVRSQKYRLDHENHLYDLEIDRGQTQDISSEHPALLDSLIRIKKKWLSAVAPNVQQSAGRAFPIGHPDFSFAQMPARDGIPHGNIKRSSKYPNDSYFTNWTSEKDSISWEVEVLADGEFEVELYYTCATSNVGATIQLSFHDSRLTQKITEAHDPPLTGMENDRDPRIESYVKDFIPLQLGTMKLKKGRGRLTLKALDIAGQQVVDVRLLLFKRLN